MIILWIVLAALGFVLLLVLIFGFLSPRYTRVERSIEIKANDEKIFEEMINLKNFVHHWSPWTPKDPEMKMEFKGAERGIGALYFWEGDRKKVGKGSMEIISVDRGRRVSLHIKFDGMGEADVSWMLTNMEDKKVKVTWDFYSDNKNNPIARIFGRMMDKWMGPDFEFGLKRLKDHCES